MKEQNDRHGIYQDLNNDFHSKEPATPRRDSKLVNLFEKNGLLDTYTPDDRKPTIFPIQVLDNLRSDVSMKAYCISRQNRRLAQQLESWKESINKVGMAYEITVYPLLEQAEQTHARNPLRNPEEHGPASYRSAINAAIQDA